MASTSETGHAKNIANLKTLNEINKGFGAKYNPSNPLLKLPAMQAQYTADNNLQKTVNGQKAIFIPLVNTRAQVFKPIKKLARRIRSAAKSSGASAEWLKDLDTIVRKILGERASKATPIPNDPAGTSASQQSFDNLLDHFNALIVLLKNEPLYVPNEPDLKLFALDALYGTLSSANDAVKAGAPAYNNAVIARNKALYKTTTGLVDVGQNSKEYVRSVFGFSSPEFKLVTKIRFRKLADVDL